jgi:hypothetical protein
MQIQSQLPRVQLRRVGRLGNACNGQLTGHDLAHQALHEPAADAGPHFELAPHKVQGAGLDAPVGAVPSASRDAHHLQAHAAVVGV